MMIKSSYPLLSKFLYVLPTIFAFGIDFFKIYQLLIRYKKLYRIWYSIFLFIISKSLPSLNNRLTILIYIWYEERLKFD